MRIRLTLLALLLLVLPAAAQEAPRPEALLRGWLTSQDAMASNLARVALREEATWTLDGPFGVRRLRTEAEVEGGEGDESWHRRVLAVEVNGRRVPRERWRQAEQQRRRMIDPHAESAARAVVQIHQLLRKLQPAGVVVRDEIDGRRAWRLELVPRRRRDAPERVTLWFDRTAGHLARSRIVVQTRRSATPFIVMTEYHRVEGLDVPRRRHIEGTTQMRRRLRTYTLLFTYEARYGDYRFFREG